jgi:hypothetical protein
MIVSELMLLSIACCLILYRRIILGYALSIDEWHGLHIFAGNRYEVRLHLNKGAEVTRWYVVNAGLLAPLNLNFIADTINARDVLFANSNSHSTQLTSYQTWTIPLGSASVIEMVFQGSYMGIDHDKGDQQPKNFTISKPCFTLRAFLLFITENRRCLL